MINRYNDFNVFSNSELEKIAKIVDEKNKTKLYKHATSIEEVNLYKTQLKMTGYGYKVKETSSGYDVYSVELEKVSLAKALNSDSFKKLAWGRYCFERQSSIGAFDYPFDDGSIWRVITDENGESFLVKDVSDDDEDMVIRNQEGNVKVASDCNLTINDSGFKIAMKILYNDIDSNLIEDISGSEFKKSFINMINKNIKNKTANLISSNNFINGELYLNDVNNIVVSSINSRQISNYNEYKNLIDKCIDEIVSKSKKIDKIFN